MDLAPHTLDILDFLFGPLSRVTGDALCVAAGTVFIFSSLLSSFLRFPSLIFLPSGAFLSSSFLSSYPSIIGLSMHL